MNTKQKLNITHKLELINYSIKAIGLRIVQYKEITSTERQVDKTANFYVCRDREKETDKVIYSTNYFWDLKNYLRYHGVDVSML